MRNNILKPWMVAVSMALLTPCVANAAGLGRLAVLSGLGQPLNAEIELLSVQKGESVVARLASVDTYQQANLQYNPALVGTRVTVEKRPNGQPYLKATTPRAINEPFVELVVELNSEHGRVTRQYTILLDPPGYGRGTAEVPAPPVAAPTPRAPATQAQEPAVSAAPAAAAPSPGALSAPQPSASQTPPAEMRTAPAPGGAPALRSSSRPEPVPAPPAVATTPASQYGPVKPGETLTRIARSVKPEGVSLEQTLVGLYRHNPDAFIKKNMNLVKSGKILRVPEATEFATVTQSEAAREIHVQVADFNALRGKLADSAASAREEGSVTSGRIGARVAEPGATEPRDTVRLSKGEPPSGKAARTGSTADRVRVLEEEAVAREKALAEANERIAKLERTIQDMQRLAELKGSGVAAVQQKPAEKSALAPQPAPAVKSPLPTAAVVDQPPAKEAEAPRSVIARDSAKSATPDAATAAPAAASKSAAGVDVAKTSPPQPKDAPAAQAAKAKPAAAMPPPPEPATDFLEMVMNEPLYLAAGGAAVVLGGLGFVMARRRRNNVIKDDDDLIKIPPTLASAPAAAAAMIATETASKASASAPGSQPSPAFPAAPGSAEGARPGASKRRERSTGNRSTDEDNNLDFNAGDGPGAVESPATSLDGPTDSPHEPDDLETTAQLSAPESKVAEEPQREESPAALPLIPDFGLETPPVRPSAPDLRVAQKQNAEDTPAEPIVRDFGLDIPTPLSIPPAPPLPSASVNEGPNRRELDVVDFNLDPLPAIDASADTILSERAPLVSEAPFEDFKLDDLDLSLGAEPVARGGVKDDHWYDVQQKFDLAKAYEEMGDKDGARDILQEVVKEGDSEQQAQANKLLGSLG